MVFEFSFPPINIGTPYDSYVTCQLPTNFNVPISGKTHKNYEKATIWTHVGVPLRPKRARQKELMVQPHSQVDHWRCHSMPQCGATVTNPLVVL